jgi:hypothetical protein
MEPKFQTSFIPKTPIVSGGSSFTNTPPMSLNLLTTFVVSFFIISILVSGGVFGFTYYLKSQIESLNITLREAKSAFDSPQDKNILLISDQLKSIKALLTEHKVISPLFQVLEKETLPTVKWSSFMFTRDAKGAVSAVIKGEAQSYASLAQQSKILLDSQAFKGVSFDNLTLSNTGTVETTIKVIINPDIIKYTSKLESLSVADSTSS